MVEIEENKKEEKEASFARKMGQKIANFMLKTYYPKPTVNGTIKLFVIIGLIFMLLGMVFTLVNSKIV